MIKFRQKEFAKPLTPTPLDAVMGVGMNAIEISQNKKAIKTGEEQLQQNEADFKRQMQQAEQEHKAQMAEMSQQLGQKAFGVVAGTMIASTAISAIQGKKSNKIAAEQGEEMALQQAKFQKKQLEQQERFQKEQMEMQERAAKMQAKATERAGAMQQMTQPVPMSNGMFSDIGKDPGQREFGVPGSIAKGITGLANRIAESKAWKDIASKKTYQNAKGFVQDLGTAAKKGDWGQKMANMAAMGSLMVGAGYVADKAIQADAKKSGIPINPAPQQDEPKKGSKLKKGLAIGAGTLGTAATTLVLARKGKLNAETFKGVAKNVGSKLGTGFKEQFVKVGKDGKKKLAAGNLALTGVFAAMPVIGYVGQKKQMQAQMQEEGQRQYSVAAGMGKFFRSAGTKIKNAPGAVVDWLSFGAGRSGQRKLGRELYRTTAAGARNGNPMTGSGSEWTKTISNFLKNDTVLNKDGSVNKLGTFGKKAVKTTGGLVIGGTVMLAPWQIGEKATKKVIGAVDKNAFAYEKSQNTPVE